MHATLESALPPLENPILEDWLKSADPMLQMDLQAIWDRHDGDAIDG